MPVYPTTAADASCASQGCVCHARTPRYPSDLTDAQWAVLEPEARAVMAGLVRASGRPMVHDLRAMLDAVGYVTRYGIEWRALPADFPPHAAVYAFFERWSGRGLPQRLVDGLRARIRIGCGHAPLPTAGSIDSQSVKAAETVGAQLARIRRREEDQRPEAAHRGRHPRAAAGGARHPGQRPGPRRRPPTAGAATGAVLHHHAGLGRRRLRRAPAGLGLIRVTADREHHQTQR